MKYSVLKGSYGFKNYGLALLFLALRIFLSTQRGSIVFVLDFFSHRNLDYCTELLRITEMCA